MEEHVDRKPEEYSDAERIASDFMCYVCGALFNTDKDRREHLEKEMHGKVRDGTTKEEMDAARHQEEVNENHHHTV